MPLFVAMVCDVVRSCTLSVTESDELGRVGLGRGAGPHAAPTALALGISECVGHD